MTEAEVSLWRAPGAFTGIAATLVFPAVNKCLGVRGGGGGWSGGSKPSSTVTMATG